METKDNFHRYEEEEDGTEEEEDGNDPRVGDIVTAVTDVPLGSRAFHTCVVIGFEKTKYGPLVHLARPHAHLDEIMSDVRQSQLAVQIEQWSVSLESFRTNYAAFTSGGGRIDNRNRHRLLSRPSWWPERTERQDADE